MTGEVAVNPKETAQAHWEYTEKIILHQLQLVKMLYIEAFIHGYGHGLEDASVKPEEERN